MDHAATTPVDPEVLETMQPYFAERYGNASSLHSFGREARRAMNEARAQVAAVIGAEPGDIIFTAGGTESDNLALKGIAAKNKDGLTKGKGAHIITSAIEHPAVLATCRFLESRGYIVRYMPVDEQGLIRVKDVAAAISETTFLISVMHANNEIGTIEPIAELGKLARRHKIMFHTDAVQTFGKVPIDVKKMNIDMLSISSHKVYGPKGVGALYLRKGIHPEPIAHGGGHERGLRSSTENISGIVGFGKAAELAAKRMRADTEHLTTLRDTLIDTVLDTVEEAYLNGHPAHRLANNAHFRFTAIEGEALVLGLDDHGIAASTGSACSSKKLEPSHVLRAIGLNEVEAHGSLRLTLGRENTRDDVDYVIAILPRVLKRLRDMSPIWRSDLDLSQWQQKLKTVAKKDKALALE